jgi:hypothetical protein
MVFSCPLASNAKTSSLMTVDQSDALCADALHELSDSFSQALFCRQHHGGFAGSSVVPSSSSANNAGGLENR